MRVIERAASFLASGGQRGEPAGVVRVVDPSPLNWLYVTYNTVEELVRVTTNGTIRPAAMKGYRWKSGGRTLEVEVRGGERFPDGNRSPPTRSSAASTSRSAGRPRTRRVPTST